MKNVKRFAPLFFATLVFGWSSIGTGETWDPKIRSELSTLLEAETKLRTEVAGHDSDLKAKLAQLENAEVELKQALAEKEALRQATSALDKEAGDLRRDLKTVSKLEMPSLEVKLAGANRRLQVLIEQAKEASVKGEKLTAEIAAMKKSIDEAYEKKAKLDFGITDLPRFFVCVVKSPTHKSEVFTATAGTRDEAKLKALETCLLKKYDDCEVESLDETQGSVTAREAERKDTVVKLRLEEEINLPRKQAALKEAAEKLEKSLALAKPLSEPLAELRTAIEGLRKQQTELNRQIADCDGRLRTQSSEMKSLEDKVTQKEKTCAALRDARDSVEAKLKTVTSGLLLQAQARAKVEAKMAELTAAVVAQAQTLGRASGIEAATERGKALAGFASQIGKFEGGKMGELHQEALAASATYSATLTSETVDTNNASYKRGYQAGASAIASWARRQIEAPTLNELISARLSSTPVRTAVLTRKDLPSAKTPTEAPPTGQLTTAQSPAGGQEFPSFAPSFTEPKKSDAAAPGFLSSLPTLTPAEIGRAKTLHVKGKNFGDAEIDALFLRTLEAEFEKALTETADHALRTQATRLYQDAYAPAYGGVSTSGNAAKNSAAAQKALYDRGRRDALLAAGENGAAELERQRGLVAAEFQAQLQSHYLVSVGEVRAESRAMGGLKDEAETSLFAGDEVNFNFALHNHGLQAAPAGAVWAEIICGNETTRIPLPEIPADTAVNFTNAISFRPVNLGQGQTDVDFALKTLGREGRGEAVLGQRRLRLMLYASSPQKVFNEARATIGGEDAEPGLLLPLTDAFRGMAETDPTKIQIYGLSTDEVFHSEKAAWKEILGDNYLFVPYASGTRSAGALLAPFLVEWRDAPLAGLSERRTIEDKLMVFVHVPPPTTQGLQFYVRPTHMTNGVAFQAGQDFVSEKGMVAYSAIQGQTLSFQIQTATVFPANPDQPMDFAVEVDRASSGGINFATSGCSARGVSVREPYRFSCEISGSIEIRDDKSPLIATIHLNVKQMGNTVYSPVIPVYNLNTLPKRKFRGDK